MHPTFRHARALATPGLTATGRRTTAATRVYPDTGTDSPTRAATKLRRASTTASMTATTGEVLLATKKTETEVLTRVGACAGGMAIRTVGIATVPTAVTITKETVTPTDSGAASRHMDKQPANQRRAGRAGGRLFCSRNVVGTDCLRNRCLFAILTLFYRVGRDLNSRTTDQISITVKRADTNPVIVITDRVICMYTKDKSYPPFSWQWITK